MRERPPELSFDTLYRDRGRGSSGSKHLDFARRPCTHLGGRVCDSNQHGRRRAENTYTLPCYQLEDRLGVDPPQANMGAAPRSHGPHERPTVCMEHGECPKITIFWTHRSMNQ